MSKRFGIGTSLQVFIAGLFLYMAPGALAGWLPPVNISETGEHIGGSNVVLDSAGNATAVWDRWNGSETIVESAYRPAGEGWQEPETVASGYSPQIAVDGDGDTTVVWENYVGTNELLIRATSRPVGGSWDEPTTLGEVKTTMAPEPRVAVDVAGDAIAVWQDRGEVIETAYRPAGKAWQGPVAISDPESETYVPKPAVDSAGDATVVWMQNDGSYYGAHSAYRPAGGSWEAPTLVSEPGEWAGNPHIALDADGDTLVAWRGDDEGVEAVRAAFRQAGEGWGEPTDVSVPGDQVQSVQVALDVGGNALVAWTNSTGKAGGYGIAVAAYRPAGGEWEAPAELSEDGGNAYPLDLVFDTSGNAAIAWERDSGTNNVVQAAYLPAGGSWEKPTDLSEEGTDAMDASLVLDAPGDETAADGNATAIWTKTESIPCPEGVSLFLHCFDHTVQAAGYEAFELPSERIEVPETGSVGAPVEVSISPENIWSPELDFGDGTKVAATSAVHAYDEEGEFEVSFASTNVLGYRSIVNRTITIGPAEELPDPESDPVPPLDPSEPDSKPGSDSSSPTGGTVQDPPPAMSDSGQCAMSQAAYNAARQRLRRIQASLSRARSSNLTRKLRRRSHKQAATVRKTADFVRETCGS